MSTFSRHFILFKDIPLMYGRVPKVANSSIKASLCKILKQQPDGGLKSTADRFWTQYTHGETELITPRQARKLRKSYFSFSFVRNPFDRLVAAYNNKVLENDDVPQPMKNMGIYHGMPFSEFIKVTCKSDPSQLDNHIRPQSDMLIVNGKLVPKFVGRMEHMDDHWRFLRRRMRLEKLPTLGGLPKKNVRRDNRNDILDSFSSQSLIDCVLERYEEDFKRFYNKYTTDQLLKGEPLENYKPIQRGLAEARERFHNASQV